MLRTDNIAWRKFCSLCLNIVKEGEGRRGEKHTIVQTAAFPIIFVTDRLKNLQNFKCGILLLLILNQIEGMYLPITSRLYRS